MVWLLKLGFKSIRRNWSRSALTIFAVMLCSGGLVLYSVLFSGMMEMIFKGLSNQSGHVRIIHKELDKQKRLGAGLYFVDNIKGLMAQARKTPGVRAVVPRINLGAFVDHKGKQATARGMGIDPVAERGVMKFQEKIVKGKMLSAKSREVLLGRLLAKRLKAKVGASIVLLGKTVDDSLSAVRVKVAGIFNMGTPMLDKTFVVNIPTAQYFLDIEGKASAILIFGRVMWKDQIMTKALRAKTWPKSVVLRNWREDPYAAYVLPFINVMLFVMGGIVVFIGGIGLLNTMTMAVLERRAEVGLMMALGLTPLRVATIFVFEGLVFGVVGAISGVGLALLGAIPMVTKGFSLGAEATAKMPMPIAENIKGVITVEGVVVGLLVGLGATLVGSLWPAYQASKLQPVDALRQ